MVGPDGSLSGCPPLRAGGPVRRALATLVDMALFCLLTAAIVLPLARTVDWTPIPSNLEEITAVLGDASWLGRAGGVLGMCVALWWCYFVVGWGLAGATPGKWLFGLRVIDHKGRLPIGATRAVMRLFAYTVSSLTFGIGHLLLLFRADRCALHDLLAGTRVVRNPGRRRDAGRIPEPPSDRKLDPPVT